MQQRFPNKATGVDEVARYFTNRARQGLKDGWVWDGVITPVSRDGVVWGARTFTDRADGVRHQSLYVLDTHTGRGHFTRYFASEPTPVVTAPSCEIEAFLEHRGIPFTVAGEFTLTTEYQAVERFYGEKCAVRSGVHYMNHIDEGLAVLARIGASEAAMRAYCLHPLTQLDEDLAATASELGVVASDPYVAALALEYRNVANAHLSEREEREPGAPIRLSPIEDVNDMLRADKVQNYKDFLLYHRDSHPRAETLARYFERWLERLEVNADAFAAMRRWLDVDALVTISNPVEVG